MENILVDTGTDNAIDINVLSNPLHINNIKMDLRKYYGDTITDAYTLFISERRSMYYDGFVQCFNRLKEVHDRYETYNSELDIPILSNIAQHLDALLPSIKLHYERLISYDEALRDAIDKRFTYMDLLCQAKQSIRQEITTMDKYIAEYFYVRLKVLGEEILFDKHHLKEFPNCPLQWLDDFTKSTLCSHNNENRAMHFQLFISQILFRYCQQQEKHASNLAFIDTYRDKKQVEKDVKEVLDVERVILKYYSDNVDCNTGLLKTMASKKIESLEKLETDIFQSITDNPTELH